MNDFVFDATRENFAELVLGNSRQGLVLAYFWSPRAGPCMVLMPRLIQLAEEFAGRFLLVLANTDHLGAQARELGVNSVPTVKFFLRGETVHSIHGAESDATFRAALARFLAGEHERARMEALRAHQEGRTGEAIEMLARAAVDAPDDLAVALDLAKLLTLDQRPDEALALLGSLPLEARGSEGIAQLLIHLELIEAAGRPAQPDSPEDTLGQAARALFADDPESALEYLLDLAREVPDYRNDIGRRGMISLFRLLGGEHPLTRSFRSRLGELSR
jgi:putative thioredoxin